MMRRRLLFLGNPIDDATRAERRIVTDSPAATRKMLMLLAMLRRQGHSAVALSMGRGRANGERRYWGWKRVRANGALILYMPFSHVPIFSELLSLLAGLWPVWRLRRRARQTTLLLYNREPAYLPAALLARWLGYRVMLDFEDAEVIRGGAFRRWAARMTDRLARDGALLANSALEHWTHIRPLRCYYGMVERPSAGRPLDDGDLHILFGGTLTLEWGVGLLAECIAILKEDAGEWTRRLHFHVTGQGEDEPLLQQAAALPGAPTVRVHGRLPLDCYRRMLQNAQIGLQLRPESGAVADTTFPSKVPELLGAGLLLVTTDVSDIRRLLGDGALYVAPDTPAALAETLRRIALAPQAAEAVRTRGQQRLAARLEPTAVAADMAAFLLPPPARDQRQGQADQRSATSS